MAINERMPYNILVFLWASGWSDIEFTDIVVNSAQMKSNKAIPKIPPYSNNGERGGVATSFSHSIPAKQIHMSIRNSNFNSSFIIYSFFCLC